MSHVHTIVKVSAADEREAIERVNALLTDDGEYRSIAPFDWVSEGKTAISDEVKTEHDFLALRALERRAHGENLRRAAETEDENWKGYYLRKAGECLEAQNFWSTERRQFTIDWLDGERVFYVHTDRHC